jgi:hypothetical protein
LSRNNLRVEQELQRGIRGQARHGWFDNGSRGSW